LNRNKTISSFLKGVLYLTPALIILITFRIYPIIKSFTMSFYTSYNYFTNEVYEYGLDNFRYIFSDPEFFRALQNTLVIVLGVVPMSIIISIFIAYFLNKNIKFSALFRGIYFMPFVTSAAAIAVVWRWLYNSRFGLINYFISILNLDPIGWLIDPNWALISLIILTIWRSLGFNIIILLVGMQNINKSYIEAAKIDGANEGKLFMKIILPLLSPTILFLVLLNTIDAFKIFSEVYTLFNKRPGPLNSALTMVYYIYDKFSHQYAYGVASAAALVLFIIILLVTLIQSKFAKRKVHYR